MVAGKGINRTGRNRIMNPRNIAIGNHVRQFGNAAWLVFIISPAQSDIFKNRKCGRVIDRSKNLAFEVGDCIDRCVFRTPDQRKVQIGVGI